MDETAQSIVERLSNAGMSEAQIAAALTADGVPITQPTIHRIKKGASTSFEIGCALVRLAQSRVKTGKRGHIALSA
jgi:hypothetical protein